MATGISNADTVKKYGGSYNITPTTSSIIIPQRTYFNSNLTILGDDNLLPENIRNDCIIGGVYGRALEIQDCTPYCGALYKNDNLLFPYGVTPRDECGSKIFKVGDNLICPKTLDTVLYSIDNGETWAKKNTHNDDSWGDYYSIDVVQSGLTEILIGVANSDIVIRSIDGLNWIKCNYSGGQIKDICYGNTDSGERWVIMTHDYKLYYSSDGLTFVDSGTTLVTSYHEDYNKVFFYIPNKTFIIENNYSLSSGYRYTSNNGSTWNMQQGFKSTFLSYLEYEPVYYNSIMYGMGQENSLEGFTVKYSTDSSTWVDTGLSTFVKKNEGRNASFSFLNMFVFSDNEAILLVGSTSLPYMYYGTIQTDGKIIWNISNYELSGISLQNLSGTQSESNYLMIGYGGIYYNTTNNNTLYSLINSNNYKRASIPNYYNLITYNSYDYNEMG